MGNFVSTGSSSCSIRRTRNSFPGAENLLVDMEVVRHEMAEDRRGVTGDLKHRRNLFWYLKMLLTGASLAAFTQDEVTRMLETMVDAEPTKTI